MTCLDNLHIKSEYERLIYEIDPLWQIGKSVPTRKNHIYNRSLLYNKKFVCRFCDEDFHVFEKMYDYILNEGDDNHVVIKERLRLGMIEPSVVTDKVFRKDLIRRGYVTKEQAKQYYPEEYSWYYHDKSEPLFVTREYPTAYAKDPSKPELGVQTYYKTPYGWTDEHGTLIDFRKPCKSTWDMRKMVAMNQANVEDAFYYTEGTCLEVIGDIAQHVLKTHIIPALYNVSEEAKRREKQASVDNKATIDMEEVLAAYFSENYKLIEMLTVLMDAQKRLKNFHYKNVVAQVQKSILTILQNETVKFITCTDEFRTHIKQIQALCGLDYSDEYFKTLTQFGDWCKEQYKIHSELISTYKMTAETELANIKRYINLHNAVKDDAKLLQAILTTTDPVIVNALTLPYTIGEPIVSGVCTKVQTYQSFIHELQERIYKLMSATPRLVGFKYDKITLQFNPICSHRQRIGTQAAEFMNHVYKVMTFQSSGYEAHLRHIGRWAVPCKVEHNRFMRCHTEPYIPFFAEKRNTLATSNIIQSTLYMAQGVNDLRDMGWRDVRKNITAFNHEGMRYRLNCDTLELTPVCPVCPLTPEQLYALAVNYRNGCVTAKDVAKQCKDPLMTEKITAKKNNVLTKISQIYRGTYYFARKKLIEQCPDEITPDMWKSINATLRQRTDRFYKNAIYKCLSTWTNSRHTIQLEDIACEKVNQFNTWLNKQTKLLKDLHQKSQARLNHYMNSEMLAC